MFGGINKGIEQINTGIVELGTKEDKRTRSKFHNRGKNTETPQNIYLQLSSFVLYIKEEILIVVCCPSTITKFLLSIIYRRILIFHLSTQLFFRENMQTGYYLELKIFKIDLPCTSSDENSSR